MPTPSSKAAPLSHSGSGAELDAEAVAEREQHSRHRLGSAWSRTTPSRSFCSASARYAAPAAVELRELGADLVAVARGAEHLVGDALRGRLLDELLEPDHEGLEQGVHGVGARQPPRP